MIKIDKKCLIFFFNKLHFIYKYSHSWKEETQNFCSLKKQQFRVCSHHRTED